MKRYVMDTSALVTFLKDETGADKVEEIFGHAIAGRATIAVSSAVWGELAFMLLTECGDRNGQELLGHLRHVPMVFVELDFNLAQLAAKLGARTGMPFLACISAVTAQQLRAVLVCGHDARQWGEIVKTLNVSGIKEGQWDQR